MNFETTTCISKEHYEVLKDYAQKYDISISTLIHLLVRFIADNKKIDFAFNRKIQYRSRKGKDSWLRIHILVNQHEYERILDIKKLCKMSLARIIEYGIQNCFSEFIECVLKKENTDNYLYTNYHFEIFEEENILTYQIYWGLPRKILQNIVQTRQKA